MKGVKNLKLKNDINNSIYSNIIHELYIVHCILYIVHCTRPWNKRRAVLCLCVFEDCLRKLSLVLLSFHVIRVLPNFYKFFPVFYTVIGALQVLL